MPTTAYRTGTVSVTPGSRIVAGIGTLFMSSQIRPGDVFELGGLTASIESVDSNIQLTLVRPWAGPLPVAGAQYEVRFTSDAVRVMASARTVQQILESGNLPALANLDSASDQLPYFNGPNSAVTTAITALARELLAQPTTQAMRTILGLSSLTSVGLRILGSFSNIGQLPTENRLIGDTYLVNGSVQIFNGTGWTNAGPIVGPAGVDGIQVFSTRAAAINGAPLLNTNVPNLMIRNMTALEVRQRNVNTAGTDPLFSTGDGWGITLRLNMNDMFIPVSAVGGTANAITATFPPALTNSVGTRLSIIPIAANTGPATLNGVQLRDMNGAVLTEGALMPGRVYQFERMAAINAWQMVAEPFGRADATALVNSLIGSFQANLSAVASSVANVQTEIAAPFQALAGGSVIALATDGEDKALIVWRTEADDADSGLDAHMSRTFWQRGAPYLGSSGGGGGTGSALLSTTALDLITVNGQSLSVGGDIPTSLPAVNRAQLIARARAGAALMLQGTARGDNDANGNPIPISTVDMPRSQGYNTGIPATGLGPAMPGSTVVTSAWPMAAAINEYRLALGLQMVPVITQCHGISGVSADDMDNDPATGTGSLTIWNNAMFVLDQAKLQAQASNKLLRVPFHSIDHGTHAQSWAAGRYLAFMWKYSRDYQAAVRAKGIEGAAVMLIDQAGGNSNTLTPAWEVVDEQLQFCEAGGGVLAVPQYPFEIADDNVHPDAHATILYSETRAWCAAEVQAANRWTIRRPVPSVIGNTLVLTFDSLREDEYLMSHDPAKYGGVGIDAYLGFQIGGGTITGIDIRGRQVVLTCSSAPTSVRYAYQSQDVRGAGNRFNAHRGLLRTSLTKPSLLLPGQTLHRWVNSFKMAL